MLHEVQDEITKELPTSFGIMFDGWSCGGEHYIGVYATWVNVSGGVTKILLACGVQDIPTEDDEINEVGFTAEDIYFCTPLPMTCMIESVVQNHKTLFIE